MLEKEILDEQLYTQKCDNCKRIIEVRSQRDNRPEYHTDVYVKCNCEQYTLFILPVN